ncbi:DUF3892 domain-containing protein [Cellulomonas sp. DKR-3]|uniref:DUF3892 domain-containing protein n=1 Tax=Cellulomonas fulva TaxID=2835530 RepID=A0ABS5U237_9CELL|nr:DUF3892 domain-containing protein [Cellulomonas fulva]MBT0995458.1 DUF3892 domain-containing protein [Cellulomonas fulva]
MNTFQVTHVSKDHNGDITAIGRKGGPGDNGWRLSTSEAIARIQRKQEGYYVLLPQRAEIIVKQGVYRPYLATTADTTTKNNLDSLPLF